MTDAEKSLEKGREAYGQGGRRAHFVLIVLFLLYLSDYVDRYVIASMLSFIKEDWGITDAQAGMLMSVVLFAITVFSIPVSVLIDRWSRRKMMSIMAAFWSLATLACRYTNNFTQLMIARLFIGVGEAGYAPAGTAMLAAAYPEQKRARVMGIWNISIPLGIGLGLVAGGLIAQRLHWKDAFGIVALPGFILATIAWFLPDYKTVKLEDSGSVRMGREFFKKSAGLLKTPSIAFTYFAFAMNVSCTTAIAYWLPTYFERVGLADKGQGGTLTLPVMALVLIGAPLGGFMADYLGKRIKRARLLLPAITSVMASVFLFFAFVSIGSKVQLPLFAFYGICVTMFVAPAAAATQDLAHPGLRALSYALCVFIQHVAGDVWSPLLIGFFSDLFTLPVAMTFISLYGLVAGLLFYLGSKTYVRDRERVEQVELVAEKR